MVLALCLGLCYLLLALVSWLAGGTVGLRQVLEAFVDLSVGTSWLMYVPLAWGPGAKVLWKPLK